MLARSLGKSRKKGAPRERTLAEFNSLGSYRFVYKDDAGEDIVCIVRANDDDDAVRLARLTQHGLALEVWSGSQCVQRLARPERLSPWGEPLLPVRHDRR
jgi:hypothetical protein